MILAAEESYDIFRIISNSCLRHAIAQAFDQDVLRSMLWRAVDFNGYTDNAFVWHFTIKFDADSLQTSWVTV